MVMTEKEKEVLKYIIEFKTVNSYAPTVREIANGVNSKSLSHIHNILEILKEKKFITFVPGKHRSINVIKFL